MQLSWWKMLSRKPFPASKLDWQTGSSLTDSSYSGLLGAVKFNGKVYTGQYILTMRITLLFTLLITHCLVQADTLTGRVVRVTDGDTIVVLDSANAQHKI